MGEYEYVTPCPVCGGEPLISGEVCGRCRAHQGYTATITELATKLEAALAKLAELRARSLHAEALVAAGVTDRTPMSDRELAVELLRRSTDDRDKPRAFRWVHVPLHHGSTVKQTLLHAAGIDPDELTGWVRTEDEDGCPVCGCDGVDHE